MLILSSLTGVVVDESLLKVFVAGDNLLHVSHAEGRSHQRRMQPMALLPVSPWKRLIADPTHADENGIFLKLLQQKEQRGKPPASKSGFKQLQGVVDLVARHQRYQEFESLMVRSLQRRSCLFSCCRYNLGFKKNLKQS